MLIMRLLLVLSVLAIVISGAMYLFTHNRRYLSLAWQIARFVLFALIIIMLLYVLERYVLIGWRTLV